MAYLARTVPRAAIEGPLREFDRLVREAFGAVTGVRATQEQWEQAAMPHAKGGLGIRSVLAHADAAYVALRSVTHDKCIAIVPNHTWEADGTSTELRQAIDRLNQDGAECAIEHSKNSPEQPQQTD